MAEAASTPATNASAGGETGAAAKRATAAPRGKSAKKRRLVSHGQAHILATYNNTHVTLTDLQGNVLSWSTAGLCGFHGPKKATPYAASIIVRTATEKARDYGLKQVDVYVKGVGSGREAAIRALHANGFNVLSIKDVTPIPHNGVRPPKPRRV